jgi:cytochrome c peroxidase
MRLAWPRRHALHRPGGSASLAATGAAAVRGMRKNRFALVRHAAIAVLLAAYALGSMRPLAAAVIPVPEPAENPVTEPKRVLGKILFWDEQLSSDNTVACGTCHRPASGGADPRQGVYPGSDAGSIDDVLGSPGIATLNRDGNAIADPVFSTRPQVTRRVAPSNFGALWAPSVFWDGRATGRFIDPLSERVVIRAGGALENQVLASLSDSAEMAKTGRSWTELVEKLKRVRPLALASRIPPDISRRLADDASYPSLFEAAFGDDAITPVRIAFAIASYERTLVADQTPWDRFQSGEKEALNERERYGWKAFQGFHCVNCHRPPLFTNNEFANIGLRRSEYDEGRERVTANPEDTGEMKVPSLRNVGLRSRLMHTGQFQSLGAAIGFYVTAPPFPDRDEIPGAGVYSFNMDSFSERDIRAFLAGALTDPRVANEEFPFDKPLLRTERTPFDREPPAAPREFAATSSADGSVTLRWAAPDDNSGVVDYVLRRNGTVIALTTRTRYTDTQVAADTDAIYSLVARDAAVNTSDTVSVRVSRPAPAERNR